MSATLARRERNALCDLFLALGPAAPTLCDPWQTKDLAAHLVLRENRPDAAPGILVPFLARWTTTVQASLAGQDYASLIAHVRNGPPVWNPMRFADTAINTVEFVVHHEDVRRAQTNWVPRELETADQATIWASLRKQARLMFRRSPVTVELATPDGRLITARRHDGRPTVTLLSEPLELLLYAYGRTRFAQVTLTGDEVSLAAFRKVELGV